MNIVIKGGMGFLGQAVAEACIKTGHQVFVIGHEAHVPEGRLPGAAFLYDTALRSASRWPGDSSLCQESDRRRSQQAGFDHHLVKPGDFGKVLQILATVSE